MTKVCIHTSIDRPGTDVLDHFHGVGSGQVVDAMGRTGGMDATIRAIFCERPVAGIALTVQSSPHDVLAIYAALASSQPGDIIVAATGGYGGSSVLGGVMAGFMKNAGVAAFITDGLVRDSEQIKQLGIPVFAAGLSPNAPQKDGTGTVGASVVVGNRTVRSGDILVADQDGAAVVPAARIESVIAALPSILQREQDLDDAINKGAKSPDWLNDFMASDQIAFTS